MSSVANPATAEIHTRYAGHAAHPCIDRPRRYTRGITTIRAQVV